MPVLPLRGSRARVAIGAGAIARSVQLVDTKLNTTGAVLNIYERIGNFMYGEVEVGQETVIFD